jgi:hypothetical protein
MPLAREVLRTLQRLTIWPLDELVAYVRVAADRPEVAIEEICPRPACGRHFDLDSRN